MNAHPLSKPPAIEIPEDDLAFHNPTDAECLISAAELLLPKLESMTTIRLGSPVERLLSTLHCKAGNIPTFGRS